jgi:hypothetical protein
MVKWNCHDKNGIRFADFDKLNSFSVDVWKIMSISFVNN